MRNCTVSGLDSIAPWEVQREPTLYFLYIGKSLNVIVLIVEVEIRHAFLNLHKRVWWLERLQ